jgi:hypothetical protein
MGSPHEAESPTANSSGDEAQQVHCFGTFRVSAALPLGTVPPATFSHGTDLPSISTMLSDGSSGMVDAMSLDLESNGSDVEECTIRLFDGRQRVVATREPPNLASSSYSRESSSEWNWSAQPGGCYDGNDSRACCEHLTQSTINAHGDVLKPVEFPPLAVPPPTGVD